jgi:DNA-binding NarL/FixJ family response regulator
MAKTETKFGEKQPKGNDDAELTFGSSYGSAAGIWALMPKNILIADDNAGVRTLIRTYLEMQTEFEICGEATDGVDAIEKIKELKPDLILLDLAMPKMNGAEVASIIKRTMPTVPIILFSVHGEKIGKSLASAVGVDIVLSKANGITNLVESVKSLLQVT